MDDLGKDVYYYVYNRETYNEYIGDSYDYGHFKDGWDSITELTCTDIDELINYFITNKFAPKNAGVYQLY